MDCEHCWKFKRNDQLGECAICDARCHWKWENGERKILHVIEPIP